MLRTCASSLAVAIALVLVAGTPAGASCLDDGARAAPRQDLALEVVSRVNAHRASIGAGPLAISPALMRSALWKSSHMATLGYFTHDDPAPPVARGAFERTAACGYAGLTQGENLAYASTEPAAVMAQWLKSSGHRANIENPNFTQIGVGAAGPLRHWTQNFGGGGAAEPPVAPPVAAPDVAQLPEDTSAPVPVTVNDTGGPWLHVTGAPANPSLTVAATADGRGLIVAPARNFNGTLVLAQQVSDVVGRAAQTTLTVRVLPVNDPPEAVADRARLSRTARRKTVRVLRNDRDVDGDPLTVELTRRPRFGTARTSDGSVIYTPRRGRWPGRDTLTYRVSDPSGATSTTQVGLSGARRR